MNSLLLKKLINIKAPILITGPTGSGKSKMAQKIFYHSIIHKEKFLTLHLASLKEELLESELFGHRKGSFTGATEHKNGYFHEVGSGTLFLDEIGELSLEAQKKLLYLLEEKKFTPIGSTVALNFTGRLIMATNRNLKGMVERGEFREDLFFRLSIFQLELSPISHNREKLHGEILKIFEAMKIQYNKPKLKIDLETLNFLLNCPWKGNYRELKNCLEYAVALTDNNELSREDLPNWLLENATPEKAQSGPDFVSHFPQDFNLAVENFEEWYLKAMFLKFEGRVNKTAQVLGMSKTTLISKAKKYQIDTLQMRAQSNLKQQANRAA